MTNPSSIDPKAYRLMRAGRWSDALPLAERAVAGCVVFVPAHSFLVFVLLKLGRIREAEVVVDQSTAPSGTQSAYGAVAPARV